VPVFAVVSGSRVLGGWRYYPMCSGWHRLRLRCVKGGRAMLGRHPDPRLVAGTAGPGRDGHSRVRRPHPGCDRGGAKSGRLEAPWPRSGYLAAVSLFTRTRFRIGEAERTSGCVNAGAENGPVGPVKRTGLEWASAACGMAPL
jgi:hypothetical protein